MGASSHWSACCAAALLALATLAPGISRLRVASMLWPDSNDPRRNLRQLHELLRQRNVQVIALDDLHFADEATIDLVASLAAQAEPPRCWLLAARPAELSPAARDLRVSLTELQRLSIVPLSAFDACAIATLVEGLAIDGLRADELAEPLLRHTGGNPLFVLETLKQGLTDGSLARGELPRPLSVGALIERRLQRVTEPALALARVAAIAGVDFSIELAEAAIGVRAVQLASAWSDGGLLALLIHDARRQRTGSPCAGQRCRAPGSSPVR